MAHRSLNDELCMLFEYMYVLLLGQSQSKLVGSYNILALVGKSTLYIFLSSTKNIAVSSNHSSRHLFVWICIIYMILFTEYIYSQLLLFVQFMISFNFNVFIIFVCVRYFILKWYFLIRLICWIQEARITLKKER